MTIESDIYKLAATHGSQGKEILPFSTFKIVINLDFGLDYLPNEVKREWYQYYQTHYLNHLS